MKRRLALVLALLVFIGGCAGAGPASRPGTVKSRCGTSGSDDQRPLIFLFCVESP